MLYSRTLTESLAVTSVVSNTEASHNANMKVKQSLIDAAQRELKEVTKILNEEHQRLEKLRQQADKRKRLRQRSINLRKANEQKRSYVKAALGVEARNEIKVGEADAGLEIDSTILLDSLQSENASLQLTPQQKTYVSQLPTAAVLKARVAAYRQVNARMEQEAMNHKRQSLEVEAQLRKLVALSSGVKVEEVDERLPSLLKAVDSEDPRGVETGRVRDFLRKVDGEET